MGFNIYVGVVQSENSKKKYTSSSGTQGNGKTACLVKAGVNAWLNGAWVFTNFKTKIPGLNRPFSYVMNFYDTIRFLNERQDYILENNVEIVICLMEMWSVISYYDNPATQDFYAEFSNQLRKFNADLNGDTQRSMAVPPGLRDNINHTYLPAKIHDDGQFCREPKCKKHHIIEVYEVLFNRRGKPEFPLVDSFDAAVYGQFYNSFSPIASEMVREPRLEEIEKVLNKKSDNNREA